MLILNQEDSKKSLIVGSANQKVLHQKDGKYTVTEKKKFEEAGVAKKKRNFVMHQSKLGTEKEQNFKKIQEAVKPRNNEKIFQTKKKVEYMDNYQFHETKDIKNKDPNKVSVVRHKRKGDIGGESYELTTFQKRTMANPGKAAKFFSSQTTKTTTTTTRKNVPAPPNNIPKDRILLQEVCLQNQKNIEKKLKNFLVLTIKRRSTKII